MRRWVACLWCLASWFSHGWAGWWPCVWPWGGSRPKGRLLPGSGLPGPLFDRLGISLAGSAQRLLRSDVLAGQKTSRGCRFHLDAEFPPKSSRLRSSVSRVRSRIHIAAVSKQGSTQKNGRTLVRPFLL